MRCVNSNSDRVVAEPAASDSVTKLFIVLKENTHGPRARTPRKSHSVEKVHFALNYAGKIASSLATVRKCPTC